MLNVSTCRAWTRTILSLCAVLIPALALADIPQYQILDLGTLGGRSTIVMDVNDDGKVTGSSDTVEDAPHAFRYVNGDMDDLGTLGGTSSMGTAINARGHITGSADRRSDEDPHAFLYAQGRMLDLGNLGTGYSHGNAINNAGHITGYAYIPTEAVGNTHAFLFGAPGQKLKDVGTIGTYSIGIAINGADQVLGQFSDGPNFHIFLYQRGAAQELSPSAQAFVWGARSLNQQGQVTGSVAHGDFYHAFIYSNGVLNDLETLGGPYSSGEAINDLGQVTGGAWTANDEIHAFLYTGGRLRDLGSLGGTFASGYAINNRGHVAGTADIPDGDLQPFVYRNGKMVLLDMRLLGGTSGSSVDINEHDQVVGTYEVVVNQMPVTRGFIATPIYYLLAQLVQHTIEAKGSAALVNRALTARAAYLSEQLTATCNQLTAFNRQAAAGSAPDALDPLQIKALKREVTAIRTALSCA